MSTMKGKVQSGGESKLAVTFKNTRERRMLHSLLPQMGAFVMAPAKALRKGPQYLLWMAAEAEPVGLHVPPV